MNCENCTYFKKDFKAGANAGFCFFNPPVSFVIPTLNSGLTVQSLRPAVLKDEFCSYFDEKITIA